ncbi:hypothetical protein JCM3770_006010 [Rhodotorula araucariae]
MPFRTPLPSQDPAVLRPPAPVTASSATTTAPLREHPKPATLRLPAPPPPPKPLYLSTRRGRLPSPSPTHVAPSEDEGRRIRKRGDARREGSGVKRRGALPSWDVAAEACDASLEKEDRGSTVHGPVMAAARAAPNEGEVTSGEEDLRVRHEARAGIDASLAPTPSLGPATQHEPPGSPKHTREPSRVSTEGSTGAFHTPVGTFKTNMAGGEVQRTSTIRMRGHDGRVSIYFNAERENPFVPPLRSSTIDTDALAVAVEEGDDPPLLALPPSSLPAVALHGFVGEPSFGELSFAQGVALRIEVEDVGGGWSLGWIEDDGEDGRGLVPRGWYAYVDTATPTPDNSALPTPHPSTETSLSYAVTLTAASPGNGDTVPSRSASPSPADIVGVATPTPSPPSSPLAALVLSSPPPPALSAPTTPPHCRTFSRSAAPSPASPASLPHSHSPVPTPTPTPSEAYATRSIGRHVVVSGIEFEPTYKGHGPVQDGEECAEGDRSVEKLLRMAGEREHGGEEGDEGAERWQRPMKCIELADPTESAEVGADARVGAEEVTAARDSRNESLDNRASSALAQPAASPLAGVYRSPPATPPRLNPPSGSFLFRLGLVPSTTPFGTSAFSLLLPVLGRTPIPGASILAATAAPNASGHEASHSLLPRLKNTRRTVAPSAAEGKALLMRWVEEGDALDDVIDEAGAGAQRWDIDAGPTWSAGEEGAYEVFVRAGRKVSPLGGSAYVAFPVETVFPPLEADDGAEDELRVLSVTRRYSHFLALHTLLASRFCAPLLSIPPLPPKAPLAFGAAKFDPALVETRRRELEAWLRRCGRHPVLRTCEEMRGFLAIEGEKELAQHLLLATSSPPTPPLPLFPARVFHPPFNLDVAEAQGLVDRFEAHCRALEVGGGWRAVEEAVRRGREGKRSAAHNLQLLAHMLVRLISGAALPPTSLDKLLPGLPAPPEEKFEVDSSHRRARVWGLQNAAGALSWKDDDEDAIGVSKAVQAAAEGIACVADAQDESARLALLNVEALLHEDANPLSTHAPLIALHRSLLAHCAGLAGLSDPLAPHDQLARCETLLNVTSAEMERIRIQRTEDLAEAVRSWLQEEVRLEEEALSHLTAALGHFAPASLTDLALTGPRLRSLLEGQRGPRTYAPLPVAGVYGRA